MFASNLSNRDRKPKYISKFWTKHGEMASDGPSPHSPSLRLGLPAPQPSRRQHAQSLLGPSFHDPKTHHVLESQPEQAALLSRRNDRCHDIVFHSPLQSIHFCWITKITFLNLCVCFTFSSSVFTVCFSFSSSVFTFLIGMNFSFKSLFAIWSLSPQRFHYCFVP